MNFRWITCLGAWMLCITSLYGQNNGEAIVPDTMLIGWESIEEEVSLEPVDPNDPDPNAFILVEREPKPVNMDEVVRLIGYPPIAKEAEIEGRVFVRILVDETGHYKRHIVIRAVHPLLLRGVEQHLSKLQFTPAIQGGKAIALWTTIPFNFELKAVGDMEPSEIEVGYDFGEMDSEATTIEETEEPDPNDFVILDREPAPINMNEVKGLIGYPEEAKKEGIIGKVIVRVMVDAEGNYVKHVMIRKVHPLLDDAVEAQLDKLKFTPGTQGGKPVSVWVTLPFTFSVFR